MAAGPELKGEGPLRKIIAKNGKVTISEEERPEILPSYILVETMYSVISPGTELGMIGASKETPIALGYSAMGRVVECGSEIEDTAAGDLVACYGAPYTHHGEYLLVPKTLYAKVPHNVEPEEAALAGIGSIAIHAVRTARLQFGETVVIAGLGLLGQMIAKICDAAGYRVIAFDPSEERAAMLTEQNIRSYSSQHEMETAIEEGTDGYGADAVLLCAGGKKSPLTDECLKWIRDKGKAVIVGDIEPLFPRSLMFAKEAQILISRAGGPGRYDPVYERQAIDYPYGFVRWTEGRNIAEYIRLVSEGRINVKPLLGDSVPFEDAPAHYEALRNKDTAKLTELIKF